MAGSIKKEGRWVEADYNYPFSAEGEKTLKEVARLQQEKMNAADSFVLTSTDVSLIDPDHTIWEADKLAAEQGYTHTAMVVTPVMDRAILEKLGKRPNDAVLEKVVHYYFNKENGSVAAQISFVELSGFSEVSGRFADYRRGVQGERVVPLSTQRTRLDLPLAVLDRRAEFQVAQGGGQRVISAPHARR